MKKETQEQENSSKSLECLQEAKELVKDMPMPISDKAAPAAEPVPVVTASQPEPRLTHAPASNTKIKSSVATRPKTSTAGPLDFQYQVLENIVHDSLESFAQDLKQDIQNMHIELLRQFQSQKVKFIPNIIERIERNVFRIHAQFSSFRRIKPSPRRKPTS